MNEQERQQYIEDSNKVRELINEYKDIRFQMSRSMLPMREGNPLSVRLDEIRRELSAYGVDWRTI